MALEPPKREFYYMGPSWPLLYKVSDAEARIRGMGLTPVWCDNCGVGPFILVPERKHPELCMDCAAGVS